VCAVPIDFSTVIANIERLIAAERRVVDIAAIDFGSILRCLFVIGELTPRPHELGVGYLNRRELLLLSDKLHQLLGNLNTIVLQSDHLYLRSYQKIITVAQHASTKQVLWLNINFELSYNFVETLQVVTVVSNTVNIAQLDMIYVLQKVVKQNYSPQIKLEEQLQLTLCIVSCLLEVRITRSSFIDARIHSS
jgi:hypothetical protein